MEEDNTVYKVNLPNAFEGATYQFKTQQRALLRGEADTLAVREVLFLQLRTEHAVRNNGYAKAALDKFVTYQGHVGVEWVTGKGKKHTQMQDAWEEFSENPCLDNHGDLKTFMATQNASLFTTGADFTRLHIRRTGAKVPLKLEGIPTSLHALWYNGDNLTPDTIHGIKFVDKHPESYFFSESFREGYMKGLKQTNKPIEVPANEILHRFLRTSAGQHIGIPFLASVLIPLYELDELTDATVAKQKAAQAIAWIIENTNPLSMTPTGSSVLTETGKNQHPKVMFKSQGGNTQYLNKGERLTQVQSGDIGQNLPVLIRSELFRICSAAGIPYHSLTGDTSGLNFSSIRAIGIELRNSIEHIINTYTIPLTYRPLTTYFYNLAKLYDKKLPLVYPRFQLPDWKDIDDLKQLQADVLAVQTGLKPYQDALADKNFTPEDIAQGQEIMRSLELYNLYDPTGAKQAMAQAGNIEANPNSSSN